MLLSCGVWEDSWDLDCKEIKPVHPKGGQCWLFIGRADVEAETPIIWPPDGKNWLTGKDLDTRKDWRQEEKGMTEDETVGWHHQTWWTWVWASSGSWWWTGKPGVLQSMGSQRVRHYLATELTDWLTERQVWNVFAVNHLKKKEIELYPVWRKIEQKEGWLAHSMEKRSSKR